MFHEQKYQLNTKDGDFDRQNHLKINNEKLSPSEFAGLKPGDTITQFNGLSVQSWEDLVKNIDQEIRRIINFLSSFIKIEISQKKINSIIQNTSFENMSRLEQKGKFKENSLKISGEKNKFFYLGPKNCWQQILKKENADSITSAFEKEMIELSYL